MALTCINFVKYLKFTFLLPSIAQLSEAKEQVAEAKETAENAAKAAATKAATSKEDAEAELVTQAQCCIIL